MEDTTAATSTTHAINDHREVYGTAKTENLSDSGLWRIFLPLVVIAGCLAFIVIPLIFLIPLLIKSFDPANLAHLSWVWITMIILTLVVDAVIIRGLSRVFFTQAGNYS